MHGVYDGSLLTTRTWRSQGTAFSFAEREDGVLPPGPNTGVCFSGGGARSHAATVGQLRGLTALGLMDQVRYLSCVSGSSWPCTPYTFYCGDEGDEALLGAVARPEQLSLETLGNLGALSLLAGATKDFQAVLIGLAEGLATPPELLWIRAVGETFLAPYGLFDPERPACFSFNDATVTAIRRDNPQLADAPFHTARAGRPFLVITSSIVWPYNLFEAEQLVSCEYTPLYVGSPLMQTLDATLLGIPRSRVVGGGYLEPFAFGSPAPADGPDADGRIRVAPPGRPFTLADASGTSSSAFSALLDRFDCTLLSPHVSCWPFTGAAVAAERTVFADGGNLENLGLLALLRRRVDRLIVFVNTSVALNPQYDPTCEPGPGDVEAALAQLFDGTGPGSRNRVFARDDYARLVGMLQDAKRAGTTVMATITLHVQRNDWWGIDGGWPATICWVYNDRVPLWEQRLPADLRARIADGQPPASTGPLLGFPHYKTDFENRHELVQLTPLQADLLGHLSCSNVVDNAAAFASILEAS